MGDPVKFQNIIQYHCFNIVFLLVLISEAIIYIKTYQKNNDNNKDRGTKWLLILGNIIGIYLSVYMVSQSVPKRIRMLVFPEFVAWIGIGMMLLGICIRMTAVLTLKKAFTLTVQTSDSQKLITTGIYKLVRNPAYSGSIISLLGIAISYRSIPGCAMVFLLIIVCYIIRIFVEEKVLEDLFGKEYLCYKKKTWRLVPFVW